MNWFVSVSAILRDEAGIFQRGGWRVVVGLLTVLVGLFVGFSILLTDRRVGGVLFGVSVVVVFLAMALVLADHVRVDDTTLFNYRALPFGSRAHARADIAGVGWARQTLGFVAPVITNADGSWFVLTALGQQNAGRPILMAEELAEALGVPFTGRSPDVGYRASGNRSAS